jgi:hypothetical protein
MEIQKVLIKSAYCLVGLSIIVLIVLTIFQHQQIRKLSEDDATETVAKDESAGETIPGPVEIPEESITKSTAVTEIEKETHVDEVDELEYQLDAAEEELDMVHEQLSDELSKKEEFKETVTQLQKKALSDPATIKRIRTSAKAVIDTNYGPLFEMLDLSPEKTDELKDLLVDQQMAVNDISPEILSASTTEEKTGVQQRYDEIREEHDLKIKELLGNTDHEKYLDYQDKLNSRYYVKGFMDSLSPDEKLTEEQKQDLIEIMYQKQEDVFSEIGYDPREQIEFPSDIDEEKIAEITKNMEKIHSQSVESAKGTMSESQLEQFNNYLKNQREIYEMSLKMTSQQFGE